MNKGRNAHGTYLTACVELNLYGVSCIEASESHRKEFCLLDDSPLGDKKGLSTASRGVWKKGKNSN